jgi:hypothetical protein
MMKFSVPFFTKPLLFMAVFCMVIHGGSLRAQGGESPALAPPVPAAEGAMPGGPRGIPPMMEAAEFNRHMEGAARAVLSLEGFRALLAEEPGLAVLDTRAPQVFAYRHIKGSVNLPLTEMTEHTLPALLPDRMRPVVLVCDESFAPTRRISMTLQAWPVLKANGYSRVYRLNLWRPAAEGAPMRGQEEIEKYVAFEGAFKQPPQKPAESPDP